MGDYFGRTRKFHPSRPSQIAAFGDGRNASRPGTGMALIFKQPRRESITGNFCNLAR